MKCTNCGHELSGGHSVCPFCGSNVGGFSFGSSGSFSGTGGFGNTPQGQRGPRFNSGSNFNTGFDSGFGQGFYSAPPPKKKNTGLIILICAICAAVVLIGAIAVGLALGNSDAAYTDDSYLTLQTTTAEVASYNTTASASTTLNALAPPPAPIIIHITEAEETEETEKTEETTVTSPSETLTAATTAEPEITAAQPSKIIPFFELRYFLNGMSDEALEVFCALYQGAMNFEKEIELPYTVTPEQLSAFIVILNHECPEAFQVDYSKSYTYYYMTDPNKITSVELPYLLTKDQYEPMRASCEAVIKSYVDATAGLSDLEKEKFVFDSIAANSYYRIETTYSGTPYGSLIEGYAKCDGFSLAMKWAMESMGIQCLCVAGDAVDGGIGHAWNIINIDGIYYQLDLTFSVPSDNSVKLNIDFPVYMGFNTSDTWIRENYIRRADYDLFAPVPRCTVYSNSYYAGLGGLIPAGTDPIAIIVNELDDVKNGRSERVYLQFESSSEYKNFVSNYNYFVEESLSRYGAAYQSYRMIWQDYNTAIILVTWR